MSAAVAATAGALLCAAPSVTGRQQRFHAHDRNESAVCAVGAVIIGASEEAAAVVFLFLVGELLEGFARQARLAVERCSFEHTTADALVAAESERLRNTLLSGISHDFRTPLTTIVGAATSLLEQEARLDARMRQTLAGSILVLKIRSVP